MGWGGGGVQGQYSDDYDVNRDEQESTVVALRMPGVYVQQV